LAFRVSRFAFRVSRFATGVLILSLLTMAVSPYRRSFPSDPADLSSGLSEVAFGEVGSFSEGGSRRS